MDIEPVRVKSCAEELAECVAEHARTFSVLNGSPDEAAARIAALRKRVEELEGALKPFAGAFKPVPGHPGRNHIDDADLTGKDFARARAVLRAKGGEHGE